MASSFPGWMPVDEDGGSPANWKAAALVVLGLYPIVCLQIKFLSPALHDLKLAPRQFHRQRDERFNRHLGDHADFDQSIRQMAFAAQRT